VAKYTTQNISLLNRNFTVIACFLTTEVPNNLKCASSSRGINVGSTCLQEGAMCLTKQYKQYSCFPEGSMQSVKVVHQYTRSSMMHEFLNIVELFIGPD